jgi:hypothetical protein
MSNIQNLFNEALIAGREVQTKEHQGEIVDGKQIWNKLEEKTGELKNKDLTYDSGEKIKYNQELISIYHKMDEIINEFKMDGANEFFPKSNHFFCQLKNLVDAKSNFNVQLNRVMQLGFNAGQLGVFIEMNTLQADRMQEIKEFVNKYKMFELDTYIDSDTQKIINKKYLKSELSGGSYSINYYQKFYKYKSKYLKLKQLLK